MTNLWWQLMVYVKNAQQNARHAKESKINAYPAMMRKFSTITDA